ncbi:glycosyltransferase [Acinetobacter sp. YH12120]|uniref:glycosyltransferase n=1 Tax=Acinetobacter sp. YH12120 TaxID=2601107 RepID=UPI0015D20CEE
MFIAVTRFSLFRPDSNAWILTKNAKDEESIKKYIQKLYDEKRLNFRIAFLKEVTLPLLEKSTQGYKFLHIIECSSNLPRKYMQILQEIEQEYHFVKLNIHPVYGCENVLLPHQIALDFFKEDFSDQDQAIGMFTLDDDDCVSLNYFKIMSKYLNNRFYGFAISLGLGVVGIFDGDYKIKNITESYYPKVNIGLMRVGMYRSQTNNIVFPKMGSHSKSDKYLPTILDSRQVSYFWSKHPNQDTKNLSNYDASVTRLLNSNKLSDEVIKESFGDDFIYNLMKINNYR